MGSAISLYPIKIVAKCFYLLVKFAIGSGYSKDGLSYNTADSLQWASHQDFCPE